MFEHAREFIALREAPGAQFSSLAVMEVCIPTGQTYHYNGEKLGPYAVACSCKRGQWVYQTACFKDGGLGVVESMSISSDTTLIEPSAVSNPARVDE